MRDPAARASSAAAAPGSTKGNFPSLSPQRSTDSAAIHSLNHMQESVIKPRGQNNRESICVPLNTTTKKPAKKKSKRDTLVRPDMPDLQRITVESVPWHSSPLPSVRAPMLNSGLQKVENQCDDAVRRLSQVFGECESYIQSEVREIPVDDFAMDSDDGRFLLLSCEI